MARPPRPKLMMPVGDAEAAQIIEIEALRQIVDNLKRLNERSDAMSTLITNQTDAINGVDKRLIRIESNQLDGTVQKLANQVETSAKRIAALEADKNRRDGAIGIMEWLLKSWPALVGFIAMVLIVLQATGRI